MHVKLHQKRVYIKRLCIYYLLISNMQYNNIYTNFLNKLNLSLVCLKS